MSGKSLDDVWKQMQARAAAEQQARIEQERAIYEQRERARQEYLNRFKMYERAYTPTAASSAAAGGGRPTQQQQNNDFIEVIAQSFLITWADVDTDTWKIVVYNFDTGELSDTIDTGLIYDSGNQWGTWTDWYNVHNKGFTHIYRNTVDNKFKIFFINADGTLVAEKNLDTQRDFQYTENAGIFLGRLDSVSTCYHYDGSNVRTHQFEEDITLVEVDDATGEDVTMDGSIIIESPNNETYYIARPNGDLVDVSQYLGSVGTGNILTDYNMNFVTKFNSDLSAFKIISQEGTLKNEFDLTPYSINSFINIYSYGDNCAYIELGYTDGKLFLSYDGDSNQFVYMTASSVESFIIQSDLDWSYTFPKPKPGSHLAIASYQLDSNDSLGYICTNLNLWWLPKGESSFLNHDFSGMGTVSFIEGFQYLTSDRSFTDGHNPIVMFGNTNSVIEVGFMTTTGFVTQSTGIQYASCSNIWGSYIGDNSYAVFDVGSDRIWQIYDANSIVAETQTTSSWSWGHSGQNAHRNGTLCVVDAEDTSKSFVYTTQIGLAAGPTAQGVIYNLCSYATRNYQTLAEQVISQFESGYEAQYFVGGFHVLKMTGLSSYVQFTWIGLSPSTHYLIDSCNIGKDIIAFAFTEDVTSNRKVIVYDKSTLTLIDDHEISSASTYNIQFWDNRVLITEESDTSVTLRFVSRFGVDTLTINQNSYRSESNDANDNDD